MHEALYNEIVITWRYKLLFRSLKIVKQLRLPQVVTHEGKSHGVVRKVTNDFRKKLGKLNVIGSSYLCITMKLGNLRVPPAPC